MGHIIFFILHFFAFLFGFVFLFITVPLHLIYMTFEKPRDTRFDGKPATGGILGGIWDDIVETTKKK